MVTIKMTKKGTLLNPKVPQTSGLQRAPHPILPWVAPLTFLGSRGAQTPSQSRWACSGTQQETSWLNLSASGF